MALKGISYKMRWRKHGVICDETQRNIYYFKKQFTANYAMKWRKLGLTFTYLFSSFYVCRWWYNRDRGHTFTHLFSSFRKLHGQRPMGFQQGRIGLSLRNNRSLFENELGFMTLLISNNKIISITINQVLPITTRQSQTFRSRLVFIY